MIIYTSYYANPVFKDLNSRLNFYCIRISASKPEWFQVDDAIPEFYPPFKLVELIKSGVIGEEKYTQTYKTILDQKDCGPILMNHIKNVKIPIVLLCWETPINFCHRHILAEKLNDIGFTVTELNTV